MCRLLPYFFFFALCSLFTQEVARQKDILLNKSANFLEKRAKDPFKEQKTSEKLTVDLRNPHYKEGILTTNEGGVIQNADIRIQAKNIRYIRKIKEGKLIHKIDASGDLMVQYQNHAFIGKELVYDFTTKTGTIEEGKTFTAPWFIGGDRIELNAKGGYHAENVYITTCENANSSWDIHARRINILKKDLMEAKSVRFRLWKFPVFWLPNFNINLKKYFKKPIITYQVQFNKWRPRGSMRYQVYSWYDFGIFLRGEYRLGKGFGGAIETEYYPQDRDVSLITRNYLASDILLNDPKKKRRYRIQGEGHATTADKKTHADITWDKYSDFKMPGDFKSFDFEVNTALKTHLFVHHKRDDFIGIFYARPRVNSFESVKQEIPTLYGTMRPMQLGKSGIIIDQWAKGSYLDYAYSDDLTLSLPDFHAIRLETHHELYRPFWLGPAVLTPRGGVIGIFYSDSPQNKSRGLGLFSYGCNLQTKLFRYYTHHKHIIEPYVRYDGLSKPTIDIDQHYIFSIQDGYNRLNQLQVGIRNLVYSTRREKAEPSFYANLYGNAFFADTASLKRMPKLYLDFGWYLPSVFFSARNAWNFENQVLDYSNLRALWTVNADIALSVEFRYRSRFDWRKSDHFNFILDVTRPENELLLSPLSDRRITILTNMFFRLSPFWSCHIQSHHGFYRLDEPPYNEFKVDLYTSFSTSWKIILSFERGERGNQFTANYQLVK